MRISSLYHSSAMLNQMNQNGMRLSKLMEQMATQKRVNVPSDDPVASSRMVQLNREQSAIAQYQSNITRLSGNLSIQESQVSALSSQLLALSDKLLSASNGTHGEKDMQGFADEMGNMLESLVSIINTKNEDGHYLFAGTKTSTQPVVFDSNTGTYRYDGNDSTRSTTVANGIEIEENTLISQAFSDSNGNLSMLNLLKSVSESLSAPGSDYKDGLKQLLGAVKTSSDQVASVYTRLGGKQNRLTLISDAHADVKISHEQVIQDLCAVDAATSYVNIQLYTQAVQASNKSFMMISQLSLFNQM